MTEHVHSSCHIVATSRNGSLINNTIVSKSTMLTMLSYSVSSAPLKGGSSSLCLSSQHHKPSFPSLRPLLLIVPFLKSAQEPFDWCWHYRPSQHISPRTTQPGICYKHASDTTVPKANPAPEAWVRNCNDSQLRGCALYRIESHRDHHRSNSPESGSASRADLL